MEKRTVRALIVNGTDSAGADARIVVRMDTLAEAATFAASRGIAVKTTVTLKMANSEGTVKHGERIQATWA